MEATITMAQIDAALAYIRAHTRHQPELALVLGSGLGSLADAVESPDIIPYEDIPNWPVSTIWGHQGRLVIGALEGHAVLVMQGRAHFYEGYSMAQITLPVRVMQRMSIQLVILTNAAGAINPDFAPGELMLITDHLNLIGMGGMSPLRGPNLDEFGPRFPDMSQVYDREIAALARETAASDPSIVLHEGVYVCLAGPAFETPADLRFLRLIGADSVGMSTVPEATVARHSGMRVLAISGISNKANLDGNTMTTHEEVIEAGKLISPRLAALVRGVLRKLPLG